MKSLKQKEDFFWEMAPDEISWCELKEINFRLWAELRDIAIELVSIGRLEINYYLQNFK